MPVGWVSRYHGIQGQQPGVLGHVLDELAVAGGRSLPAQSLVVVVYRAKLGRELLGIDGAREDVGRESCRILLHPAGLLQRGLYSGGIGALELLAKLTWGLPEFRGEPVLATPCQIGSISRKRQTLLVVVETHTLVCRQ